MKSPPSSSSYYRQWSLATSCSFFFDPRDRQADSRFISALPNSGNRDQKKETFSDEIYIPNQLSSLSFKIFVLYIFDAHAKSLAQYHLLAFSRLVLYIPLAFLYAGFCYICALIPFSPCRDFLVIYTK